MNLNDVADALVHTQSAQAIRPDLRVIGREAHAHPRPWAAIGGNRPANRWQQPAQEDMRDAGNETDPGPRQRHFANVMQQTRLADVRWQTSVNRLIEDGEQVALVVGVQVLKKPPGSLVRKDVMRRSRCSSLAQGEPDLVQSVSERRSAQNLVK